MKKLIITESQAKRLGLIKEDLIKEGVSDSYSRQVKMTYYYHGVKLKGHEIDDIMNSTITVRFNIEIDAREWGIKDISLYGIAGPEAVDLEVTYWASPEEQKEAVVQVKLNWEAARTEGNGTSGLVTVGDEIEVTLDNDAEGNLIVKDILVPVLGA